MNNSLGCTALTLRQEACAEPALKERAKPCKTQCSQRHLENILNPKTQNSRHLENAHGHHVALPGDLRAIRCKAWGKSRDAGASIIRTGSFVGYFVVKNSITGIRKILLVAFSGFSLLLLLPVTAIVCNTFAIAICEKRTEPEGALLGLGFLHSALQIRESPRNRKPLLPNTRPEHPYEPQTPNAPIQTFPYLNPRTPLMPKTLLLRLPFFSVNRTTAVSWARKPQTHSTGQTSGPKHPKTLFSNNQAEKSSNLLRKTRYIKPKSFKVLRLAK